MKYGYARVSTSAQDLSSQIQILEKEGCQKIYSEKITGMNINRPEFEKLLKNMQAGDTLVVTKLDRFTRSTKHALEVIENLFERHIKVHVLNLGIIENTQTGRLIFTILSAFANFERDLIVERTQEGKIIAKKNKDYQEGRPKKYSKEQMNHAMELLTTHSFSQVERMTGISKSTLTRHKKQLKF